MPKPTIKKTALIQIVLPGTCEQKRVEKAVRRVYDLLRPRISTGTSYEWDGDDIAAYSVTVHVKKVKDMDDVLDQLSLSLQRQQLDTHADITTAERRIMECNIETLRGGLEAVSRMMFPEDVPFTTEVLLSIPTPPQGHDALVVQLKAQGIASELIERDVEQSIGSSVDLRVTDRQTVRPTIEVIVEFIESMSAPWASVTICTQSESRPWTG